MGSRRVRQDLATEPEQQQSKGTPSAATESWPLWGTPRGFLTVALWVGSAWGQAMGRMPKEEPSRAGESLLPAPAQQAYLKSAVRLDPALSQLPQRGQCARPPRRVCSLPPLCCPQVWGWCPEVAASWVLAAPLHALQTLPKGSSSERATCFLLDSTLSRTATRHARE